MEWLESLVQLILLGDCASVSTWSPILKEAYDDLHMATVFQESKSEGYKLLENLHKLNSAAFNW